MVGDFFFVSKISYGMCIFKIIVMILFLYNWVLLINKEFYLKKFNLKFCWFGKVDVIYNVFIVFNFLVGDSVYVFFDCIWFVEDVCFGVVWEVNLGYD